MTEDAFLFAMELVRHQPTEIDHSVDRKATTQQTQFSQNIYTTSAQRLRH